MLNAFRLFLVFGTLTIAGLPLRGQQNEFRALADGLAEDIKASGKKTIAVVDFTDLQGNPTELGRYLAEELSVAMARTHKGFEVIDRVHLKAILTEHKLAATGLIDPATARKLGQISGADVLLTGSMTPFSESVRVTVKALNTDTARIIGADTIDLPKTATISELLQYNRGAQQSGLPSPVPSTLSRPLSIPGGSSSTPTQSSPVVVAAEFTYELIECKGTGGTVRCTFRITNNGADQNLTHNCGGRTGNPNVTRAFDNLGNEYPGDQCALANQRMGLFGVAAHLVSGIPVPASVMFQNVSTSASALSLITIRGGSPTSNITVSFRNVPIVH